MKKYEIQMNLDDLVEYRIKESPLDWYEKATISKAMFINCLTVVPHIYLEGTKKRWRESIHRRNLRN